MNNNNKFNKEWWEKNPMVYEDWELPENIRSEIDIDKLKKINFDYVYQNPYLNDFFENLKNNNQNNTVLDIGCGWGSSSILLSNLFNKVHAIDISSTSILKAKKNSLIDKFLKKQFGWLLIAKFNK